MRIQSESEVLDPKVRKQIIEEIMAGENQERKNEAFKRYECYKDLTKNWVVQELLKTFSETTVSQMGYAIANVSLVKKVINKLARVYSNGVTREIVGNKEATDSLKELSKTLELNDKFKKTNRYLRLQNNVQMYLKPVPLSNGRYTVKPEILQPYLYDVVEDYYDRTKMLCLVISDYEKNLVNYTTSDVSSAGVRRQTTSYIHQGGDGKDQVIADSPIDSSLSGDENKQFIWWTNSFHFTTDSKGVIISSSDEQENPIKEIPSVDFNLDQDNQYWSIGGSDLIDAGILINSMLTQVNNIGVVQGYGQMWMKGKKLPTNVVVGPNKIIRMEYEEGEPVPDLGFAQADPKLQELMEAIQMYTALTLTTNNLSTSGVSTQLSGSATFPSGIAMLIDKAESQEDVKDQQELFVNKEQQVWDIIKKWMDVYASRNLLDESLLASPIPDAAEISVSFPQTNIIQTEKEKLEVIEKRKDLGLNTMIELMMLDNPGLTKEQAAEKLVEITKEKIEKMAAAIVSTGNQPNEEIEVEVEDEGDQEPGDQVENNLPN